MTDNQPGDEMPEDMPAWPAGDDAPEIGDMNGLLQLIVNGLFPLPDGRSQVVSGFALVVETMASDGARAMRPVLGPTTTPWTGLGMLDVARDYFKAMTAPACDCDSCEDDEDDDE